MPGPHSSPGAKRRSKKRRVALWAAIPVMPFLVLALVLARFPSKPLPLLPIPTSAVLLLYTPAVGPSTTPQATRTLLPSATPTVSAVPTRPPVTPALPASTTLPTLQLTPNFTPPSTTQIALTRTVPAVTSTSIATGTARSTPITQQTPGTAAFTAQGKVSTPGKRQDTNSSGATSGGATANRTAEAGSVSSGSSSLGGTDGKQGLGTGGVLPGASGGLGSGIAKISIPSPTVSVMLTSTPYPTFTPSVTPSIGISRTPVLVQARVIRVIDGDTLEVSIDGHTARVRLIGMDSPDINKPKSCGVQEAKAEAEQLLGPSDGRVLLEQDNSDTDRYGRLLRYVWLPGGGTSRLLNLEMVRQGYAKAAAYPPDTRHESEFEHAEQEARSQNLGLWALCAATFTAGVTDQPEAVITPTTIPTFSPESTATSEPTVATP